MATSRSRGGHDYTVWETDPTGQYSRDYTQNHQVEENSPAIKKWCRQILTWLDFLHSQNEPIIHNDLKCENIFVVGKSGTIKLGDLSAAKTLVLTSPENHDAGRIARSEVYCLGLCVLQTLTDERLRTMDFSLLNRIQDRQLRNFIQKCVYPADIRPTITQLLNDPFLLPTIAPSSYTQVPPMPATSPARAQPVLQPRSATDFVTEHRRFTLQGERIDRELIAVTLRTTEVKNTDFVFSLSTDTVSSMMDIITAEVNTNADVELMAHTLERLRFFIPNIGLGEQKREADGNVINSSNAAAENSEGDIDNSNTAAANSEGDIDDSNIDAANSEGDINNSNAAAANSEGDIDDSNAAAANSEGNINDSNIALSFEEA
ncbi:serine/threonine-protein kinase WNK8-like [Chenopodium quinoa]|uniref:serine/threonine-protein kinase WNK8-like n=1 Tax=Chenopodium quinoa TaxID=63459 RepID=UPI000B7789AC|nr:serine/threonine-protein kinase WNK8-like [Chenopodium quinoa]